MATSLHDIPGEHVAYIPLREHAAATATEYQKCFLPPFRCKITEVSIVFDAAITGADSNSTTVSVVVGETTLKSIEYTSGTNAAATDVVDFSPSSPHEVAAAAVGSVLGSMVSVGWTKVGNGLKIPSGLLIVKYQGA